MPLASEEGVFVYLGTNFEVSDLFCSFDSCIRLPKVYSLTDLISQHDRLGLVVVPLPGVIPNGDIDSLEDGRTQYLLTSTSSDMPPP